MSSAGQPAVVEVTLTDAGDGTVEVTIDGAGRLGVDRALLFGIAAGGNDYLVVLRPGGAALGKWNGADWAPFPHRALAPRAYAEEAGYSFSLALADLGTQCFDYWLAAVHGDDVERAPQAAGGGDFPRRALERGRFTSLRA